MFDNLKGMAGLAGVMKDLPRLKQKMEEVKLRLGEIVVEAETGGGAVRVKATAQLRIISIDIDDVLMNSLVDSGNPDDRAMAEDLMTGAVNAALEKAREAAELEMSEAAREFGLPIPSGGLGGLLGM